MSNGLSGWETLVSMWGFNRKCVYEDLWQKGEILDYGNQHPWQKHRTGSRALSETICNLRQLWHWGEGARQEKMNFFFNV